ncbi:MAG: hypothetical protein KAT11_07320, partial [Phycisphaerae bacterium]|nr:hypothetical protein [Phycisphaerae bacterium]
MLANHIRHSLPFVCLLLLGLLLPQALAESEMQVKVLDEPLAIEMPVDLDQNVFVEAKYVAVVKGVSEFFDHVPFKKVMEHAQDDV